MKNFCKLLLFLISASIYSQNISAYRYIYVPSKFKQFDRNKYGLNDLLISKLKAKNYTVITENPENWPEELRLNPCKVLKAEVLNNSNLMRNRIVISVNDCHDKPLEAFSGVSLIKEFEPGFKDALASAVKNLPRADDTSPGEVSASKEPLKEQAYVPEKILPGKLSANGIYDTKTLEVKVPEAVFTNGTFEVHAVYKDGNYFILAYADGSAYAVFRSSTKKDVYHVQLSGGAATLGYTEGNEIIIDLLNPDGTYRREVFRKK